MQLYLLRHAIAVPRGTAGYQHDAQRPLTDEGHAQAREVAAGLKRLKLEIEAMVTSPYLRAVQTAQEAASVLGMRAPIQELAELRAEANPRDTSLALKRFMAHDRLLLVGHEPHLSAWIAELVAGRGGMRCLMKKAGVACVEVDEVPPSSGRGTLRWLMTPKQLTLVGAP